LVIYKVDGWKAVDFGDLDLGRYNAILFGEVHHVDWIISFEKKLLGEAGDIGFVAMEHFNYEMDRLLERWICGCIDWDSFVEEYRRGPEGFDLDSYKPLLQEARDRKIPIYGAMPPRDIASKIAKEGLTALTEEGEIHATIEEVSKDYPGYVDAIKSMIPREGPMAKLDIQGIIYAQAYKDTIMAKRIFNLIKRLGRGILYTGYAHIEIPGSVSTRLKDMGVGDILVITSRDSDKMPSKLWDEANLIVLRD